MLADPTLLKLMEPGLAKVDVDGVPPLNVHEYDNGFAPQLVAE
jgi:hypothetical protein